MDWKLTRGKFRPRLLDYAKEHSEEVVQAASTKAFQLALSSDGDDGKAAIAELAKLKASGAEPSGSCIEHKCWQRPRLDRTQARHPASCRPTAGQNPCDDQAMLHRALARLQPPRCWPLIAPTCHS